jgi:rare lipoprotein A
MPEKYLLLLILILKPFLLPAQEKELISGKASFYADKFEGRKTANGEIFNNSDFTAAHRKFPFNSLVRVTNPVNHKTIVVRINDRGPFKKSRVIDLTRSAAKKIGLDTQGETNVEIELTTTTLLTHELEEAFHSRRFSDCLGNAGELKDYSIVLWRTKNLQHMLYMANDMDDIQKAGKVIIERREKLFYLVVTGFKNKQDALSAMEKLKKTGFFKARLYDVK